MLNLLESSLYLMKSAILVTSMVFNLASCAKLRQQELAPSSKAEEQKNVKLPVLKKQSIIIEKNSNAYSALRAIGLSSATILDLSQSAANIRPLEKVMAGDELSVTALDSGEIIEIQWHYHPIHYLSFFLSSSNKKWQVKKKSKQISLRKRKFSGKVSSNLWDSAYQAGTDPKIIMEMAEIFAWQIDFNREVRRDDKWRLVIEEKFVENEAVGFGKILVAQYLGANGNYTAIFNEEDGHHYTPEGSSLQSYFLKSPIKFGRITSRFSKNRFHPILKKHRPHYGVDYGAPKGTPVRTIGKGLVTFAGWKGSSGKIVKIRHNSIHQTAYHHLSRIEKNIRKGVRVDQGQIIGYVGSTGLSTAPHLHFAFYENGRFVDPLNRSFAPQKTIKKQYMIAFQQKARKLKTLLPPWENKNNFPTPSIITLQWDAMDISYL